MACLIRLANEGDAPAWLDLLKTCWGDHYPAKEVYDLAWIARQLNPVSGHETWLAESQDRLMAGSALFKGAEGNRNPVLSLQRNLFRPESYNDDSALVLGRKLVDLGANGELTLVSSVPVQDTPQQLLFEELGFVCAGFAPARHVIRERCGALFYVRPALPLLHTRRPLEEALPFLLGIARLVLAHLGLREVPLARDGTSGYALRTGLELRMVQPGKYASARWSAAAAPQDFSTGWEIASGLLRVANGAVRVEHYLACREAAVEGGVACAWDAQDRCLRVSDWFTTSDTAPGPLLSEVDRLAQERFGAVVLELDVLVSAARLLKTAEQLGFVPVAYLPAVVARGRIHLDVVKLLKLNLPFAKEKATLAKGAMGVVELADRLFQESKAGAGIVNLLRDLPLFQGLGDGDLGQIVRHSRQRVYRPGEVIFNEGDSGEEAYLVMRGQIDVFLGAGEKPIGSVGSGRVLGELAFLDGAPRGARAVASQPTVALGIPRQAFADLVLREPHIGLAVMRNLAADLAAKLRSANSALSATR